MTIRAFSTTAPTGADEDQAVEQAELLVRTAYSAIGRGDWRLAAGSAHEVCTLADRRRASGLLAHGEAAAGIVAAVRGDATTARSLLERSEGAAAVHGISYLLEVVQLGRGVEALSSGRYDEAWAHLGQLPAAEPERLDWVRLVAIGFLAEAGLHGGDQGITDVVSAAIGLASPELFGATAYARAMASRGVPVDARFERALTECPADRFFDVARIHFARGVFLRRERRVLESRWPLQEALVAFERLGARSWAEHARRELRATGMRSMRRELGAVEPLTEQELQIVRLAAAGLTNREIGQRLFLSHRTIGSHLYRAFPKLGIAARSQLRDVLEELQDLDGATGEMAN